MRSSNDPAFTLPHVVAIGVAAFLVRVLLAVGFVAADGMSFDAFAFARDGEQFAAYAQSLSLPRADASEPDAYTLRLFPLTPAVYAATHTAGVRLSWAMLGVSWVCSAVACAWSAVLLRSVAVGWLMVAFTPSWLLCGVIPSTEALFLLLTVAGMWAAGHAVAAREGAGTTRRAWSGAVGGGLLLGLAGLTRPMACFAAGGCVWGYAATRRWKLGLALAGFALGAVVAGFAVVVWRFGGLVTFSGYAESTQAYAQGGILDYPLASLIRTPRVESVAMWKIGYVWLHVVFAVVGCGLLIRDAMGVWRSAVLPASPPHAPASGPEEIADSERATDAARWLSLGLAGWACGTVLFALCTGDRWGFHEFPRFIVPCLPALLYSYRGAWRGRSAWWWAPLIVASLGMTYIALKRSF